MDFYNRQSELKALNNWWKEKKAQLVIVYGKRRVGKTELCLEFSKDKEHVYFLADRLDINLQLKKLSRDIGSFFRDEIIAENGFKDWEQLFKYIASKNRKFILIIDEFPYLVETEATISSVFQKGFDLYLKNSPVFLILSGSSIGMMEKHTLIYKAPLYGRRTGQMLIEPFTFNDFDTLFPKFNFEDKLLIYSTVGGTISYLLPFIGSKNIWSVIEKNILTKGQLLYEEVGFLLREELREPRNYFSILLSLALGKTRLFELMNDTGFDKSTLSSYLANLQQLLIVKKEVPITEKTPEKSRKGSYRISDNFFEFWFRYVFKNKGLLEEGKTKEVLNKIKNTKNELISKNYELFARDFVKTKIKNKYNSVGRWWEKEEEIDLVAINQKEKEILFGEVKWTNKFVGTDLLERLKEKAKKIEWNRSNRKEKYILFSKSGFTDNLKNLAKKESIYLVHQDKMQ